MRATPKPVSLFCCNERKVWDVFTAEMERERTRISHFKRHVRLVFAAVSIGSGDSNIGVFTPAPPQLTGTARDWHRRKAISSPSLLATVPPPRARICRAGIGLTAASYCTPACSDSVDFSRNKGHKKAEKIVHAGSFYR